MENKVSSQPVPKQADDVLIMCRGLLAGASGSEDDPFLRVVLTPTGNLSGKAPLLVGDADWKLPDKELRESLKRSIDDYTRTRGARPAGLVVGGTAYAVSSEADAAGQPLRNKVAIVTGAAGAIGAGICRGLLEKGCRVAATDLVKDRLDDLVRELGASLAGRVIGITMDVTDPASVRAAFASVAGAWGGVDIVIVNAGIAAVGPLVDMDIEAFRRAERVNIEGALLTLAEGGRRLCRQGTGGDIIVISTKNVFSPGAQFGAYSATKAACHQLARIASLELASSDIRVNMVAPDAVFSEGKRKSGLWAEVGPSRMQARGLDEKGLEEYYRNRNLLKARVTAKHVANAVLFFATRQTPTTGATIPVDGGLPDATPR